MAEYIRSNMKAYLCLQIKKGMVEKMGISMTVFIENGIFAAGMVMFTVLAAFVKLTASWLLAHRIKKLSSKIGSEKEISKIIHSTGEKLWINISKPVEMYVDKLAMEMKIMGADLSTVDKLSGQSVMISATCTVITVAEALFENCGKVQALSTILVGISCIFAACIVDKISDIRGKLNHYKTVAGLRFMLGNTYIQEQEMFVEAEAAAKENMTSGWRERKERYARIKNDKKEIAGRLKAEKKKARVLRKINNGVSPEESDREALEAMRKRREERKLERRERTLEFMKHMDMKPAGEDADTLREQMGEKGRISAETEGSGKERMPERTEAFRKDKLSGQAEVYGTDGLPEKKTVLENERVFAEAAAAMIQSREKNNCYGDDEKKFEELEEIIKDFFSFEK